MKPNPIAQFLLDSTNIKQHELRAAVLSFLFVFILMAAYYLLRPVRDAMASDWTDAEVSWLWTLNFFLSTALVALYGYVVSKVSVNKLIPVVYAFFALTFVGFYAAVQGSEDAVLVDKAFYLWVSVFALFHVSVFWTFMANTFNKEQAARLFSVIAMGASLGAIAGPSLAKFLAPMVEQQTMVLFTALMLFLPIPIISSLIKARSVDLGNNQLSLSDEQRKIGGNPMEGFKEFFSNPYLLGIGLFIILYTGVGTFLYFEQKNLLADFTRAERSELYSLRDLITNTITFTLGFFLTGRIVPKLGMNKALVIVPTILMFGMLVLAFSPILIVAVGLWITRSAGNYGLARPAREMLFTQVDEESRYKTKPVIDIVAYRGGDVIMSWFFTGLTQGLGLGLAAVAVVGAGLAALWGVVGWLLGKQYEQVEKQNE